MNKRLAKRVALEHCAALIDQQLNSSFGFIDASDDAEAMVRAEAERIRDSLYARIARFKEQTS